jgi:hypothetical protein
MIVDVEVYIPKRWMPGFLLRWFFLRALIRSSAPYYPRVNEQRGRQRTVAVSCPECSTQIEVQR